MPPIIQTKPYWQTNDGELVKLYLGNVLKVLPGLPSKSVHTIITSPPYWGLRDYKTGEWEGGSKDCDHALEKIGNIKYLDRNGKPGSNNTTWQGGKRHSAVRLKEICPKCGARRTDNQLGSEEIMTCNLQGFMKLKDNLSEEQRNYVIGELIKRGLI